MNSSLSSFVDLFQTTVKSNGDKIFTTFYNDNGNIADKYTFSELWDEAGVISYHLRKKWNLNKGDRVVLCYNFGLQFFASFLGCIRAGVVAVLVYPPAPPLTKSLPKMTKVINDCDAKLILIDSKIQMLMLDKANLWSKSRNLWPNNNYQVHGFKKGGLKKGYKMATIPFNDPTIRESDLAFLQYTSGSTGDPKGVMVTYGALQANVKAVLNAIYQSHNIDDSASAEYKYDNIVGFSWLPQYHDMGLIEAIVAPFAGGCRCHMMSPLAFIKSPLVWIDLMSRHKVTWSLAPDFAFRLVTRKFKEAKDRGICEPIQNLDLSSIVVLQSAAEPVRKDTIDAFKDVFFDYGLNKDWLCVAYGLAETVVHASHIVAEKISVQIPGSEIYAVGHRSNLAEGQIIKVVNPKTHQEIDDGTVGELWLSGPSITGGYFGKPELTEEVFRAKIEGLSGSPNFLRTGDLAFFEDNYLYICGRQKDLIIVNGVNYYPQDVEFAVVDASALVRPGCVAAFSSDDTGHGTGNLEIVFEIREKASKQEVENVVNAVKIHVFHSIKLMPSRVVAIQERTILKTTSGKIQRRANRVALHEGNHSIKYEWVDQHTSDNIEGDSEREEQVGNNTKNMDPYDKTLSLFFGNNFNSDLSWEELGLSSIASVQLRDAIYSAYTISLPPDCFELYTSPNKLKDYILSNQGLLIQQKLPPLVAIRSWDLSWIVTTSIQALCSIFLLFVFSFPIVPSWYVGKYMVNNASVTTQSIGIEKNDLSWVWIPIVIPTWIISFTILTVLLKWIVIGKYREGTTSLSSLAYLRWWFVDRNIALWEFWVGRLILNTPLINIFYFLMGAKIHRSATVDALIREFDLVEVGQNASVEHQIRCHKFKYGNDSNDTFFLEFRSIIIRDGSTVKGMLSPGCTVYENATIEKLSVVPEGGQVSINTTAIGNPAYLVRGGEQPMSLHHSWLVLGILKLLWIIFELYLFSGIVFLGQYLWAAKLPSNWRYTPLLSWFLVFTWFPLVSIFTSVFIKWALIGKRRPGAYNDTLLREFADWAADWHYKVSTDILYSVLLNSRIWNIILMMHGMDIDFRSKINPHCCTPSQLDLIKVSQSFTSSGISFSVNKNNTYHTINIHKGSIGHSCHLKPGVKVSNDIIPPQSIISTSIMKDQPNEKSPKNLTMFMLLKSECISIVGHLTLLLVIFVHFIPSYELWTSIFHVDSISVAFVALPAALLVQTFMAFISIAAVKYFALAGAFKSKIPWSNEVYQVYHAINYFCQTFSVAGITMQGSPMYNLFLRMLGITFCGHAIIFETLSYEHEFLTLGHMTLIYQSLIGGHYVVYDKVTIGPCKITGIIHPGVFAANAIVTSKESGPWRTYIGTYQDVFVDDFVDDESYHA